MIAAGQAVSYVIVKDKSKKTTFVMSCGEKAGGKLGLGYEASTNTPSF